MHLVAKESFQAWTPLSGVVFRKESDFEVKNSQNNSKKNEFPKKMENANFDFSEISGISIILKKFLRNSEKIS